MVQFALRREGVSHDVEQLLQDVGTSTSGAELRLPTHLGGREFGRSASFMQACASWAHRFPDARLRTYTRSIADLEELLLRDHGLVCVLLSRQVADFSGEDITWDAQRLALARLQSLQDLPSARRGAKVFLVAADDTSSNAPPALYATTGPDGGAVRSDAGFVMLAKQFIDLEGSRSARKAVYPSAGDIGSLLAETVRNTHQHARLEADDLTSVSHSVRYLRAEKVNDPIDTLLEHAGDDDVLRRFLEANVTEGRGRYLELTVWDAGPGLAARRLRDLGIDNPTIEQEWRASVECFEKHVTSSRNGGRGKGLDNVQLLMTALRGFLRVRTGRVMLERDYSTRPHHIGESSDFGHLIDRAPTRGTTLTLLIPDAEARR
jgi:hypothetical protein